ncbi:MAG: TraB/GumN family protein [Sandaracinus sp.]
MTRTFLPLLALTLLACSGGESPSAAPPPSSAAPAPPSSVVLEPAAVPTWLYEIQTESQPSYVFAALDPGVPLHESFPPDYEALYTYARAVIVPMAWDPEQERAFAAEHGLDPSFHLDRVIGSERFEHFVARTGAPAELAVHVRPEAAIELWLGATVADLSHTRIEDTRLSPTHDLVARRQAAGLPTLSLATPARATELFATLERGAADTLSAILDHPDETRANLADVRTAYLAGDEAALLAAHAVPVIGRDEDSALRRRENLRLLTEGMPVIEQEIRAGNALVLLPYGMVLTEDGLLARLRTSGLIATRITSTSPASATR